MSVCVRVCEVKRERERGRTQAEINTSAYLMNYDDDSEEEGQDDDDDDDGMTLCSHIFSLSFKTRVI